MKSRAVTWSLNRFVFVNLPMQVPTLMRFSLAIFVAFLMICSLQQNKRGIKSTELGWWYKPGCKESHFYSMPFGQAEANIYWLISQFFCILNSSKNFTCLSGKLITEFTSPIAKSTSPGLSDTTFFARCKL